MPKEPLLSAKEDRYGGVEAEATVGSLGAEVGRFDAELRRGLEGWKAAGKKGIWLKIPTPAAACVGSAVAQGFHFHHAQEDYVMLTQYAFTQVGVGGIVLNSKAEVLMVQERVSPLPQFQGSWKLPGGLADPGEDFAETVLREVQEETGITGELDGLVSLRHSHGYRFGQDDLYVLVKLKAKNETINIDPAELSDARWMSEDEIKLLASRPKVAEIARAQSAPSLVSRRGDKPGSQATGVRHGREGDVASLPPQRWGQEAGNRFRVYAVAKTGPDRQVQSRKRFDPGQ
eukprot:symbB.v1.2.037858.t1/scaffold5712.1/size24325/1